MNKPSDTLETQVIDAYRRLDQAQPGTAVDDAILAYARKQVADDHRHSAAWVWPLSIAAALVVCVGLFVQIANLMPDSPRVIVMEPQPQRVDYGPPPAVGQDRPRTTASGSLSDSIAPDAALPQPWLDRLTKLAEIDDPAGFRVAVEEMREAEVAAPLPPELRQWALQRGLDDLINGG